MRAPWRKREDRLVVELISTERERYLYRQALRRIVTGADNPPLVAKTALEDGDAIGGGVRLPRAAR